MPRVLDRIKDSTTTTGTGTFALLGAQTGFRGFSAFTAGDQTFYVAMAVNGSGQATGAWEVGLGTVGASGASLTRDSVYASSNAGNLVSFSAGTKHVFCDQPAAWIPDQLLNTDATPEFAGLTVAGLVYPQSDGSPGWALVTDGSGALSFAAVGGNPFDQDLNTTDVVQHAGIGVGIAGVSGALTFGAGGGLITRDDADLTLSTTTSGAISIISASGVISLTASGSVVLSDAAQLNWDNQANVTNDGPDLVFNGSVTLLGDGSLDMSGGEITGVSVLTVGDVNADGSVTASAFILSGATQTISGSEVTAPSAPAADGYVIYGVDTGGKTALMVRFASGASQQLAVEP